MARVTGKNGAVSFSGNIATVGAAIDISSWGLRMTHPVDDDTSYNDTGAGSSHSGSGTVDYALSLTGFAKSNVTGSAPDFGGATAAVASAAGGSVTLTAQTGCTEVGVFILSGGSIDHKKRAGAIPVSYDGMNDGSLAETWAVS